MKHLPALIIVALLLQACLGCRVRSSLEAEWHMYRASISGADAAILAGDMPLAQEQLARAPEQFREWEWNYLAARANANFASFVSSDKGGGFSAVAFSPGGHRIAAATNKVTIWDAQTAEELMTLAGRALSRYTALTFDSGGQFLAAGGSNGTLRIWNTLSAETADNLVSLPRTGERVVSLSFNHVRTRLFCLAAGRDSLKVVDIKTGSLLPTIGPQVDWRFRFHAFGADGTRAVAGAEDGEVTVWNLQTRTQLAAMHGHTSNISCAAFSPDGSLIATGSYDKTVRVWDTDAAKELATLRGHTEMVSSVVFSPDGTQIASASLDGTVRLWEAKTGDSIANLIARRGSARYAHLAGFSPDGAKIATWAVGGHSGALILWDAQSGQELATLSSNEFVRCFAFSPEGSHIAGGVRGEVRVWDTYPMTKFSVLHNDVGGHGSVEFNADGIFVVSSGSSKTVIWELLTGEQLASVPGSRRHVTTSPDGRRVASTSYKHLHLWDMQTGEELAIEHGHESIIISVAFSSDGSRVVTAGRGGEVISWDASTGEKLARSKVEGGEDSYLSPDAACLVTTGKQVRLWVTKTGQEIGAIDGELSNPVQLAFSQDARRLSLWYLRRDTRYWEVWDLQTYTKLATFEAPIVDSNRFTRPLSHSADGTLLAALSKDNSILDIWDTETGERISKLEGHAKKVTCVSFSPDGRRVATGSDDRTVKLWSTRSGDLLITLRGHEHKVEDVAFSPDGARIVSSSWDGTIRVWDAALVSERCLERYRAARAYARAEVYVTHMSKRMEPSAIAEELRVGRTAPSPPVQRAGFNLLLRRGSERRWNFESP